MLSKDEIIQIKYRKVVDAINTRGISIVNDHEQWYKVAFAIASVLGENGREDFYKITSTTTKNKINEQKDRYDYALKKNNKNKIGLSYIVKLGKDAGIDTTINKSDIPAEHQYKKNKGSYTKENKNPHDNNPKTTIPNAKEPICFFDFHIPKNYDGVVEEDAELIKIKPNTMKYIQCLNDLGFRVVIYRGIRKFGMVRNNIVKYIEDIDIAKVFQYEINNNTEEQSNIYQGMFPISRNYIKNHFNNNTKTYLKAEILNQVEHLVVNDLMMNDTANASWYFYKNTAVNITKEGLIFVPYSKLNRLVFEKDILNREIKIPKNDHHIYKNNIYGKFIKNVAGSEKRCDFLKLILGYGLHKNYTSNQMQFIYFTDSRIGDTDENNGGSGKGLLIKGMERMYNSTNDHFDAAEKEDNKSGSFVRINAELLDFKQQFKFSMCSLETKFFAFEEMRKNMPLRPFFEMVENGIEVRLLHTNPFNVMCKQFGTGNSTIALTGESEKRRFIQFDLADYYNSKYTPYTEFQKWFWRDFDADDWADFDFFMLSCLHQYIIYSTTNKKILPIEDSEVLQRRVLLDKVGKDLVEFLEEKITNVNEEKGGIVPTTEYDKKQCYEQFLNENTLSSNKYSQRKFTDNLRLFKKLHPEYKEDIKDKQTGKYTQEKRSGGRDYIFFQKLNE